MSIKYGIFERFSNFQIAKKVSKIKKYLFDENKIETCWIVPPISRSHGNPPFALQSTPLQSNANIYLVMLMILGKQIAPPNMFRFYFHRTNIFSKLLNSLERTAIALWSAQQQLFGAHGNSSLERPVIALWSARQQLFAAHVDSSLERAAVANALTLN